jgi:hypothetical protein
MVFTGVFLLRTGLLFNMHHIVSSLPFLHLPGLGPLPMDFVMNGVFGSLTVLILERRSSFVRCMGERPNGRGFCFENDIVHREIK